MYVCIICLLWANLCALYWQMSHLFHTCSHLLAHSVVSFHCVLPKLVIIFYFFADFLPMHYPDYYYYYASCVCINQFWCPLAFNDLLMY